MRKDSLVNAYTLMEITIAMLLSAICITICYTAFGLIQDYYAGFRDKNESTDVVLSLQSVMEKDFLKARYIIKEGDGVSLASDSLTIVYHFTETTILREIKDLHTDTFKVKPVRWNSFFENAETIETDTLDLLDMELLLNGKLAVLIQLRKKYSAEDLIH